MPLDRLTDALNGLVARMEEQGTAKGAEVVVREVIPAGGGRGPRFLLEGQGDKRFIRMNANSYLGLSLHPEVIEAEETTARAMGAGPGAVRFIAGTHAPHTALERELAAFHGREEGMIFSSAYAAVVSALGSLLDRNTFVLSDELNHNCIINAIRMSRPAGKAIYPHLDMAALDRRLEEAKSRARRAVVVTDGIFSMRGDHAPVDEIMAIAERHDRDYAENVVVVVDDSHGVGAFGATGRGTEEYTDSPPCDILIGTLGKAFGVNGGYVVSTAPVIRFLRESSPLYIYSNPITAGEAAAARKSLEILRGPDGAHRLRRLHALTKRFESGLVARGFETIPSDHPITPIMVRDTAETRRLVAALFDAGVLATGLAYPVVPRGDESIRFQINADHTEAGIDQVLAALAAARPTP
ncbi:MAG: aminotransferase class I/II-fold pyridoxal phosphate-dependent enzyme [Gemmatimonadota bacterium]|nr:aminotransferase class I/II-fold pyridoxal phosphate-dependent enzyme [Gemmatimonadota bacterium]MDE2870399.1 aminotransferase class I/II-fold pyridoxal phosphate-dependent enzyme [Gemmatimonadota bacterium]